MSLRFTSQLNIDNLPDEQLNDQFEVIMPTLTLLNKERETGLGRFMQSLAGTRYQPIVEEITFGHKNFQLDTRRVRTGWFGVPKDIERFHDVKITMFCPISMATYYYLESWKDLIFNKAGEYYYPATNYKKNIDIYIKGPIDNAVLSLLGVNTDCHITLQGCFPYTTKDFEFEYTNDPKRFRILATFNVDNIKFDTRSANQALTLENVSSPTSLLDKAITGLGLGGSSGDYSIDETYGGTRSGKYSTKSLKESSASSLASKALSAIG